MGPRKPHRTSSTSGPNTNYCPVTSIPNMLLETSFTSLQSPSSNSSFTNGFYSTLSQPSPSSSQKHSSDFNMSVRSTRSNMSFRHLRNGQLMYSPHIAKRLDLNLITKDDLMFDAWLGSAPLASPESTSGFSIISSVASIEASDVIVETCHTPKIMKRTSKIIGSLSTCADDIQNVRNFEGLKKFPILFINEKTTDSSSSSNISFESASSDVKGIESTKSQLFEPGEDSLNIMISTTSRLSTGSDFQSAEDILDNVLASAGCKEFFDSDQNILEPHSDSLIEDSPTRYCRSVTSTPLYTEISPGGPKELDPDILSNLAIELAIDADQQSMRHLMKNPGSSLSSGSTYTTIDSQKNVTFNPQVMTVDSIREPNYSNPIRWRLFKGKKRKQQISFSKSSSTPNTISATVPKKTILSKGRRTSDDEKQHSSHIVSENSQCFSRTEMFPLLSGLNNTTREKTSSPSFVNKKKSVYPSDIVVLNKPSYESSL